MARKPFIEIDETEDREAGEDEECLFCTMIDEEPISEAMATALAYGLVVVAAGDGVATCEAHDEMIKKAIRDLKREVREMKDGARR
jgi:hypothetical protein